MILTLDVIPTGLPIHRLGPFGLWFAYFAAAIEYKRWFTPEAQATRLGRRERCVSSVAAQLARYLAKTVPNMVALLLSVLAELLGIQAKVHPIRAEI